MEELVVRVDRGYTVPAPFDHSLVNIDPYVAARLGILLEQLPRESTAAASEIEHRLVSFGGNSEVRIDRSTARVVESCRILRPNQLSQFQGRYGHTPC